MRLHFSVELTFYRAIRNVNPSSASYRRDSTTLHTHILLAPDITIMPGARVSTVTSISQATRINLTVTSSFLILLRDTNEIGCVSIERLNYKN